MIFGLLKRSIKTIYLFELFFQEEVIFKNKIYVGISGSGSGDLKDDQGKLKYICTDPSRQIFQYKSDDGKIQKDVRATKLTKAILDGEIKQTSHKIAWDNMKDGDNDIFMSYTNHYQDIQDMEQDNSEFSKELSSLTV